MIALCYFQNIAWYKIIVCFIQLYRILYRLSVESSCLYRLQSSVQVAEEAAGKREECLMQLSVAVCCSVLQCVAVCCSALQCVAVCRKAIARAKSGSIRCNSAGSTGSTREYTQSAPVFACGCVYMCVYVCVWGYRS